MLLCRMYIVYPGIFGIVLWNCPLDWHMQGWFAMLVLMGFFDGECPIRSGDVYFVFSF